MEKVAFLNLSYDSFNHDHIWKQFFDEGDPDSWNLYIHSKTKRSSVFSKHYIKNPVPTAWGEFSLIEATILMMKEALKDKKNEYFTLISGAHIPLYPLDELVSLIKNRYKKMTFAKHFSFHTKNASRKIFREGLIHPHPFTEYNAVCQFFTWRRKDAIQFVVNFEEYSKFFVKNHVIFADEFYFWAIAKDFGMDFNMGKATTYSDWRIILDNQGKPERTPRIINPLNEVMVDLLRKEGFLYARKLEHQSLITKNPVSNQKNIDSPSNQIRIDSSWKIQ